jgi:hypothetical protein
MGLEQYSTAIMHVQYDFEAENGNSAASSEKTARR